MFHKARLKLTAWYLLIITIISFSFSLLIYQLINTEINRFANSQRRRFENNLILENPNRLSSSRLIVDQDLINESRQRLLINLISINGVIIVVSGILSYLLAGRTLSPIQKMTKDQKRFISDASHELKTPITALKSLFEVSLRDKKINLSEAKKTIKNGLSQTNNLQHLSNSLLKIAALENNHLNTNFSYIPLKKVIDQSLSQLQNKAESKKIKITTRLNSEKIYGDQTKLVELFTIFIDNAIKYSPRNTQIKITSQIKNNKLLVKVIDQGIGISKEHLPYIFNRFYQINPSRSKNDLQGYGLGLSIANNIVQAHQIKVEVVSKKDKGTTFNIFFPNFS